MRTATQAPKNKSVTTLKSTYINGSVEALSYRLEEELFKSLTDLCFVYNPNTGPVRKVVSYFGGVTSIPNQVGHSEYYNLDYIFRRITGLNSMNTGIQRTLFAGGKGAHLPDMFISSISETIERVLGSLFFFTCMEKLVFGSYRGLSAEGFNCLAPEEMALFAPEQYAESSFIYTPFTKNSLLGWIEGQRLLSGKKVLVPAQLVMLFYSMHPQEDLIGYATSGGLSSHINKEEALYHGITELIERDAINIRWISKIPPLVINFDCDLNSEVLRHILGLIEEIPNQVLFHLHTVDIREVAVVTAIQLRKELKRYAYYPGGGADIDIEVALAKALNEFAQSERPLKVALYAPKRSLSQAVSRMFTIGPDDPVSKINIFFKVVAYYGYPKNIGKLEWYLRGSERIFMSSFKRSHFANSQSKLLALKKILAKHKLDPIIFDFTPKDLNQISLVKTFIPELTQPFLHTHPYLGNARFYEMPKKLGYLDKRLAYGDLLHDPLPYP